MKAVQRIFQTGRFSVAARPSVRFQAGFLAANRQVRFSSNHGVSLEEINTKYVKKTTIRE